MLTGLQENEGDNKEEIPEQPGVGKFDDVDCNDKIVYDFEYRTDDSSLFISVRDRKLKRVFSTTLNREQLKEMGLPQSTQHIQKMIENARNSTSKELTCTTGYYSSITDNTNLKHIRNRYQKGDALIIIICINAEWFAGEYVFKLAEHEREEIEILHDIIQDLRDEIGAVKKKNDVFEDKKMVENELEKLKGRFTLELNQSNQQIIMLKKELQDEIRNNNTNIKNELINEMNKIKKQLQDENEQKEKTKDLYIAVWTATTKSSNYLTWNTPILYKKPMDSCVRISNYQILFSTPGVYSVDIDYVSSCGCSNGKYVYLYNQASSALLTQHYCYSGGGGYYPSKISYTASFVKDSGVSFLTSCACAPYSGTRLFVQKLD